MSSSDSPLFQPAHISSRLWGHGAVLQHVRERFIEETLPPVLLLYGTQGIGKATLAYHMARLLLNVQDPQPWPLPEHHALWRRVSDGTHPDFLALTPLKHDASSKREEISIEQVREALHFLQRHPAEAGVRVVLVDTVDQLNTSGVNALLKTLEEPRPKTFLIMVSHHLYQLPPTLRSRCYRLACQPITQEDIQTALQTTTISPDTYAFYTTYSGGRLGWIEFLHRYGGMTWHDTWSDPSALASSMMGWAEDARKDPQFLTFLMQWMTWWMRHHLRHCPQSSALYHNIQYERDIMAAFAMLDQLNLDARQVLLYTFNRLRTLK